jgi:hypothetical protein
MEDMDGIELAQNMHVWQAGINAVPILRVPYIAGHL